ncbi:MAG: hypothetical protein ISR64_08115 [Deltaproteobacteria bacterium]|nr:hypothetical protein [Deltaproteobacteria bacterium]
MKPGGPMICILAGAFWLPAVTTGCGADDGDNLDVIDTGAPQDDVAFYDNPTPTDIPAAQDLPVEKDTPVVKDNPPIPDQPGDPGDVSLDLDPKDTCTPDDGQSTEVQECVPEGGSVAVIPNAPECCDGLKKIPCDAPDEYGFCLSCDGAAICAKCGNGDCGPGENVCNCPEDCAEPCDPPDFPTNCAEVSQFQCGFMAECKAGELQAQWHHHWFCNGMEDITDFWCSYTCPNGCKEGTIEDWPVDGKALVTIHCIQCVKPEDCEALSLPHDDCDGHWECLGGQCNWICDTPCLGLGGLFMDTVTDGKCCDGLTPVPDCDIGDGGCICKKCPCYICVPCGDKVCGPFEHKCNCEVDCPDEEKCVPTDQSECAGSNPGDKPDGVLKLGVNGHDLSIVHAGVNLNCCHEFEICFTPKMGELVVKETIIQPAAPCFCMCDFDLSATLEGIKSGTYAFSLYNEEKDKVLFTEEVVIP